MTGKVKEPDELYKVTFYVKVNDIKYKPGFDRREQNLLDILETIGVKNVRVETVTLEKPELYLQEVTHRSFRVGSDVKQAFSIPAPNKINIKAKKK